MRSLPLLVLALGLGLAAVPRARAQEPLRDFLASARERALDVREAAAAVHTARAQAGEARGRLLPTATGTATYQYNEPEIVVNLGTRQAVISPHDQGSVVGTLSVPILDLGAWGGFLQSEAAADASDASLDLVRQNVAVAVVQLWHLLVAQRALLDAARRNLETAEEARASAAARVEVGVSPQLELSRAEAERARATQALAAAQLQATLAARNLENLTGRAPGEARAELEDDLSAERPLEEFVADASSLPGVRFALQTRRAAGIARDTAWLALLPTISGTGVIRWTNASGFGRQDTEYVGITATWVLDFVRPARIGTAGAQLEAAEVRADRALQQAETAIFEQWNRVESARASVDAAQAALEASRRAVQDATARYETGAATQLDLIQAQRDLFQAEVGRIQALADLRVARATLRIRSGMEP